MTAVSLLTLAAPSAAGLRQYQASLADSDWVLTKSSALVCQMEHQIPSYGAAEFQTKAGKEMSLAMTFNMLRQPRSSSAARLVAVPPSYRPGKAPSHLATVRVVEGFDTSLNSAQSWAVLTELEQGNNPTLFYEDGYRAGSQVEVMLNSANFKDGYNNFIACVGQLLPYGFEDVKQTVLNYRSNSDELDLESLRRLHKVVDYISHDPAIVKIEIGAYSDSYGGRWHNYELSKKRANALKVFLQESGIKPELLKASGYGERRHIASNETELGRQQNRRVVLRLTRDESYDEKMTLPSQIRTKAKQAQAAQTTTGAEQAPVATVQD